MIPAGQCEMSPARLEKANLNKLSRENKLNSAGEEVITAKKKKRMETKEDVEEVEHNDLDTGTFLNTSDWPANKHILA